LGDYVGLFKPVAEPLQGVTSINLEFDDNCMKGVSDILPTATITLTPTITYTPTVTPTPDCSKYRLSPFTFSSWALQSLIVTNNDIVDTYVTSIELNWNFLEQYGVINGYPYLNVDWFTWNGAYFHLGSNGDDVRDYSSPTIWDGILPFSSGSSYTWEIDFDNDWGGGKRLTGIVSNDFGVVINFDNGCQLRRDPVPRPIISWTPTNTPTITPTSSPLPPPTSTSLPTSTLTPSNTPTASSTPSITPASSVTATHTSTTLPPFTYTPSSSPDLDATATPSSTPNPPTPTTSDTPTPDGPMPPFD
jgi:hypothetical protein